MGKIFVEGIKIYAHHGCFKEEALIGTNFLVDVELDADLSLPANSDNINDAVNYQAVFSIVKEQMAIRSNLLEHVGKRIIEAIFNQFVEVEQIRLKVAKLNVPLGGHIDNTAIQFICKRGEVIK